MTQVLLREVHQDHGVGPDEILLTALALAFREWTGQERLLVELERHGREALFEEVDLSRTVGWFTSMFPVLLDLEGAGSPVRALKAVKEQLDAVPQRGIGYDILRYLSPDQITKARLAALPRAGVVYNYLGQMDQVFGPAKQFRLTKEPMGPMISPKWRRIHLFEIVVVIIGGRLQASFVFSRRTHRHKTVSALAHRFVKELQSLIDECHPVGPGV